MGIEEEEAIEQKREKAEKRHAMLSVFEEADRDNNGTIVEDEWEVLWSDEGLRRVLEDSSGLKKVDWEEIYCMTMKIHQGAMPYEEFITIIEENRTTADFRSIIRVLGYLQDMVQYIESHFKRIEEREWQKMSNGTDDSALQKYLVADRGKHPPFKAQQHWLSKAK